MKMFIDATAEALERRVAADMAGYIRSHPGALLCLAAGDTPLPVYKALVRMHVAGEVDLTSVYYVGLDEWVGMGYETRGSCAQLMQDTLYGPAGIGDDRKAVWNGLCDDPQAEIRRIEAFIQAHGHINFTLLGIGMNGHIGFNEPGSGLPEGGILVELSEVTKRVSDKYFDRPMPVKLGFGVGAGALKKAETVYIMATGARKRDIVAQAIRGERTAEVPVSLMLDHPDCTVYLDGEAAACL